MTVSVAKTSPVMWIGVHANFIMIISVPKVCQKEILRACIQVLKRGKTNSWKSEISRCIVYWDGEEMYQKVWFTAELLLFKNRKLCKQGPTWQNRSKASKWRILISKNCKAELTVQELDSHNWAILRKALWTRSLRCGKCLWVKASTCCFSMGLLLFWIFRCWRVFLNVLL